MKKIIILWLLFMVVGYTYITSSTHIDGVGDSIMHNGWFKKAGTYTDIITTDFSIPGIGVVQNAYKNTEEYQKVLCRQAEYVLIALGANDWY